MLAHQNTVMAVGGVRRHDISVLRDDEYHNDRTQRELDELETSKTRLCLKKTAKFLFSHIGLVVLVVVYAAAGGFLFELLEKQQERLNCREAEGEQKVEIDKLKQKLVAYVLYNTTLTSSSPLVLPTATYVTDKENMTVAQGKIADMLEDFRDFILNNGAKYRYSSDDCSIINKWTYLNSLLFAITIITTIGYGNITPVTWEGQICCICYATIGIPIFLLCVANISGVLGEMFRFLYARVLCKPCNMIKRRRAMARKVKMEEESGIQANRANNSGWSLDDNNNSTKKPGNTLMNGRNEDDEPHGNQRVTVPLTITMLIIAAYIWAGSMIFNKFESWTLTQSGYFCFITLATIGFGDFVPGQTKDDPSASAKLVLGAIYVLFGMAILAMCFDLMQEEIVAKFRWIGRKLGIIEKDEDLVVNTKDKAGDPNNRRASITSSGPDQYASPINGNGKMIDDENDNGWPAQQTSNGGRKQSPRNNNARVHPMSAGSNEGTLHQRAGPSKMN